MSWEQLGRCGCAADSVWTMSRAFKGLAQVVVRCRDDVDDGRPARPTPLVDLAAQQLSLERPPHPREPQPSTKRLPLNPTVNSIKHVANSIPPPPRSLPPPSSSYSFYPQAQRTGLASFRGTSRGPGTLVRSSMEKCSAGIWRGAGRFGRRKQLGVDRSAAGNRVGTLCNAAGDESCLTWISSLRRYELGGELGRSVGPLLRREGPRDARSRFGRTGGVCRGHRALVNRRTASPSQGRRGRRCAWVNNDRLGLAGSFQGGQTRSPCPSTFQYALEL